MHQQFNYIEEADQTMSDTYHQGVPANLISAGLDSIFVQIDGLDKIKKYMFYGRHDPGLGEVCAQSKLMFPEDCADVDFEKLLPGRSREDGIRLFHGIIGAITEAGEMAKALAEAIESGQALDLTNLVEEIGDQFWYNAAALRVLGVSFEHVQKKNIEKLRARFPDRFTEFDANNRNLDLERRILEEPGLSKPLVAIENWVLTERTIFGDVVDHPKLGTAKGIMTSRPTYTKGIPYYKQGDRVETKNTMYVLGTPSDT